MVSFTLNSLTYFEFSGVLLWPENCHIQLKEKESVDQGWVLKMIPIGPANFTIYEKTENSSDLYIFYKISIYKSKILKSLDYPIY